MPFRSEAQRRFLFARHPDVARRFAAVTPKGAALPEHVGDTARAAKHLRRRGRRRKP